MRFSLAFLRLRVSLAGAGSGPVEGLPRPACAPMAASVGALTPPCRRLFGPPCSPLALLFLCALLPTLFPLPYPSGTSGPLPSRPSKPTAPQLNMSLLQGTADVSAIEAPVTIKAYLL